MTIPHSTNEASAGAAPETPAGASRQSPGEPGSGGWATLDPAAKRERLLTAARDVFATQGLGAPMSEVAEAAGAGVASVYRCYPSKHDLVAALVAWRMNQIADAAQVASARDGDRWTALTEMLTALVRNQRADDLMGEARVEVGDHPDVVEASERAGQAMDALLADARAEGRLRADATSLDLRLLFAATRAARRVEPELWPRMLALMIDALDTQRNA